MHLLLTGSSRCLGRFLASRLRNAGHTATALDVAQGVNTHIIGSVSDRVIVDQALAGASRQLSSQVRFINPTSFAIRRRILLKCARGPASSFGIQTKISKAKIAAVIRRATSEATKSVRLARQI